MNFVLALTIGLLAFLFIDTLKEALEMGGKAAESIPGHGDGRWRPRRWRFSC